MFLLQTTRRHIPEDTVAAIRAQAVTGVTLQSVTTYSCNSEVATSHTQLRRIPAHFFWHVGVFGGGTKNQNRMFGFVAFVSARTPARIDSATTERIFREIWRLSLKPTKETPHLVTIGQKRRCTLRTYPTAFPLMTAE